MVVAVCAAGAAFVIAVVSIITLVSSARFTGDFKTEVEAMLAGQSVEEHVISEDDLKDLPEPVKRYLRFTGVIGKEMVSTVRLKSNGAMRLSPNGPWKPLKAVEYYGVSDPGFIWLGKAPVMPLVSMSARDSYVSGKGRMLIKMQSVITLGDSNGFEMDYSGLERYLNEMMWFPMAFLKENIYWESIDDLSAKVTITNRGMSASAILCFDEKGAVTNFIGQRYHEVEGNLVKDTWTTPITGYSKLNGMNLPSKGEATWKMAAGDFCYFQAELTEIEYNVTQLYNN